jgi:catechol 2,3-dioxygenase-like lactoylglutathione lyase family enzyme
VVTEPRLQMGCLHHVGFVVRTIAPSEAVFAALGYDRLRAPIADSHQDADIVFLRRHHAAPGEPLIELIAPRSDQSTVAAFARESRFRIHHLCFTVDDMESALHAARARRMTQVSEILDAPAIGGRRIVFLFSRETGLFELAERPPF